MENIFSLPGLGRLMLSALTDRDYTLVSGINLVFGTVVVAINLTIANGEPVHPAAPPAAQHRTGADRHLQHQHRRGGDQRGIVELPWGSGCRPRCRAGAAC